jgi:hypothetical protein
MHDAQEEPRQHETDRRLGCNARPAASGQ